MSSLGLTITTFLGFLTVPIFSVAQTNGAGVARVKIEAVNEGGVAVACRVEAFVEIRVKRDLAKHFQGLDGVDIPYGVYDYRLGPGPFPIGGEISGRVSISQPEEVIVAVLPGLVKSDTADFSLPTGFVIIGRVEPMPSPQEMGASLRLRLSPIDGNHQLDVSVDPSGQFRLYAPLVGRYVLTVVRGVDVLHSEIISFEQWQRPTPLIIRLRERPPTVTRMHPEGKH